MSRKLQGVMSWSAAAVLALGSGACGDDDGGASATSAATTIHPSAAAILTPLLMRKADTRRPRSVRFICTRPGGF